MNRILPLLVFLMVCPCLAASAAGLRSADLSVFVTERGICTVERHSGLVWRSRLPDKKYHTGKPENIRQEKDRILFDVPFSWDGEVWRRYTVSLGLEGCCLTVEMVSGPEDTNIPFIPGFSSNGMKQGCMAVCDNCDGHLYSLTDPEPPGSPLARNLTWYPVDRLAMPFVCISRETDGAFCTMIIDTPDDGLLISQQDGNMWTPRLLWLLSRGKLSYTRRLLYYFCPEGGYNRACKLYRDYLKQRGGIVTLKEKIKNNPDAAGLAGAVSVWGRLSFEAAAEMKKHGVRHALLQRIGDWVQLRPGKREINAIKSLGYLVGEYDNYADMYPLKTGELPDNIHGNEADSVKNPDGSLMHGWFDGTEWAGKRCPRFYLRDAMAYTEKVSEKHPFNARFFDVLAAQELLECYDPVHSLSKTECRHMTEEFFRYFRDRTVVGSEQGIWWAVPYVHYFEGMESAPCYPWFAERLEKPASRNAYSGTGAYWKDYDKWNMGYAERVPLWQLVFHDCVVVSRYWGDSNDWLAGIDRQDMRLKNLFNILYGSMPLLWSCYGGSWETDKKAFYEVCDTVLPVTEQNALSEMLRHSFVTEDKAVQKTVYDNGNTVYVNFGRTPWTGEGVTPAPPGFAVKKQ